MTAETLAAAILRDVPRYVLHYGELEVFAPSMLAEKNEAAVVYDCDDLWIRETAIRAALTSAMSDDLAERAGAILTRLGILSDTLSFQAHDLITSLLAKNAALRSEREKMQSSRDRYREAWESEKRRFTEARADLKGADHE